MKRSDEELCKAAFDGFLQTLPTVGQISWREVERANEPPDYYLLLDQDEFAVEVTDLVEQINVVPKPIPTIGLYEASQVFVRKVEQVASKQAILHGTYTVSAQPVDNFAAVRDSIQNGILEYLRDTATLPSASERILYRQNGRRWKIRKAHIHSDRIGFRFSYGAARWEVEAEERLCEILDQVLVKKAHKLRNISAPRILLVLDCYSYGSAESWRKCIPLLSSLSAFHTLFRVNGAGTNFPLYSVISEWRVGS